MRVSFDDYDPYAGNRDLQLLGAKMREKKTAPSRKIYVRYTDGAEMYSMSRHSFMKLAAEAGAVRKINRLSLVNTKIFEEYIESFAI